MNISHSHGVNMCDTDDAEMHYAVQWSEWILLPSDSDFNC